MACKYLDTLRLKIFHLCELTVRVLFDPRLEKVTGMVGQLFGPKLHKRFPTEPRQCIEDEGPVAEENEVGRLEVLDFIDPKTNELPGRARILNF